MFPSIYLVTLAYTKFRCRDECMQLWKIEIYENQGDSGPVRWGVMCAESEEQAVELTIRAMSGAARADVENIRALKLNELPEGTIFWSTEPRH